MHRDTIARGLASALTEDGDIRSAVCADLDVYLRALAIVLGLRPHRLRGEEQPQRVRAALALL